MSVSPIDITVTSNDRAFLPGQHLVYKRRVLKGQVYYVPVPPAPPKRS
ncbi:MAG TPA: hypothetical protein VIU44_18325 [Gaiellaceae bacterium]